MARTQLQSALRQLRAALHAEQLERLSDAELLERFVRDRDEPAFALLVARHGRLVWSVCRQALRHEQDAEDAYQASFLVLVRRAGSIRRGQSVACWLYRVALRVARKLAMDRVKQRRRELNALRPAQAPVVGDLAWRELQGLLQEELGRLPDKYQAPFVLCCLDGKSKSEAARQLGWKEGTVSSRLAHARKQLQQSLARRGVALASVLCVSELFLTNQAVPASLTQATARAALCLLAGNTGRGVLSPAVVALMEGALTTMVLSKIKNSLSVIVAVCLIGTSAAALAWQRQTATSSPDAQSVVPFAYPHFKAEQASTPAAAAKTENPWIGIASRETNSGPELRFYFEGGARGKPIAASADTVLLSYMPDNPLGGHEVLSIDLADTNRVLLRFDLPNEAGVEKVELVLSRSQSRHPAPATPLKLAIHEVKQSWDENTATWNRQPQFDKSPALTCELDPAAKEYRVDVTRLVRGRGGRGGTGRGKGLDDSAQRQFQRYDLNGDGVLNQDEMPENLRAELDKWDTDKNGLIDLTEFKAWMQARIQQRNLERDDERVSKYGWLLRVAKPLDPDRGADGLKPSGWLCHGDDHIFAVDDSVRHGGKHSCRIESRNRTPAGFAMLSQTIRADNYRGERIRLSGYLKTESLEGMATLWMRVDGENGLEGIDKTVKEAVRATSDWQQPHIVMEVPETSQTIRFAALVEGGGKAWVDDLKFEIVDRTVPLTNAAVKPAAEHKQKPQLPRQPVNLDFESVSKK